MGVEGTWRGDLSRHAEGHAGAVGLAACVPGMVSRWAPVGACEQVGGWAQVGAVSGRVGGRRRRQGGALQTMTDLSLFRCRWLLPWKTNFSQRIPL